MKRRNFIKSGLTGLGALTLYNKAFALKYYPKPSDKKCAIIYSTWCGSSRDASVWISEGMCGIAEVFDLREEHDLKKYDHIIIGGSIRYMQTSKELQNYILTNKDRLKNKVRGLFAVCGNMQRPIGPEQKSMLIDNHLAKLCEVPNVPSRVFLGRITKCLLDPESAKMLANMEDYDNLKRSDCLAFGQEILSFINKRIKE